MIYGIGYCKAPCILADSKRLELKNELGAKKLLPPSSSWFDLAAKQKNLASKFLVHVVEKLCRLKISS